MAERRGVHRPDGQHDEGDQRRVAPARRRACGPHRQPGDPADAGPRQQHHRGARDVREDVRAELVDDRCGQRGRRRAARASSPPSETPRPPANSRVPSHNRWATQSGHAEAIHRPVPRTRRPQVGDDLVRHPAEELAVVPRLRRVGDQTLRVEVEEDLGVCRHLPRRRRQHRHVGQQGEHGDAQAGRPQPIEPLAHLTESRRRRRTARSARRCRPHRRPPRTARPPWPAGGSTPPPGSPTGTRCRGTAAGR